MKEEGSAIEENQLPIEMGKVFRERRKFLGLTQENVAEKAGISLSFYAHIERGTRVASIMTVKKLCEALSVSSDRALGLDIVPPDIPQEQLI